MRKKLFVAMLVLMPLAMVNAQDETTCVITDDEMPWVENFETVVGDDSIPCWSQINGLSTSTSKPSPSGQNPNTHLYFLTGANGGSYVYAIAPRFENVTDKIVKLYLMHGNSYTMVDLGVMTDPTDTTTFTLIHTFEPAPATNATATWEYFEGTLSSYEGTGQYIAFRARSTSGTRDIRMDDVTIDFAPACLGAQSVDFSSISTTGATLNIHDSNYNANNSYNFSLVTDEGETQYFYTSDTTYELSDLVAGTDYAVSLVTSCGTDGTETTPIEVRLRTACEPVAEEEMPVTYTFDDMFTLGTRFDAMCWFTTNTYPPRASYPQLEGSSNDGYLTIEPGAPGQHQTVALPIVESVGNMYVEFDVRGSDDCELKVGVMTDPEDYTTFEELFSIPSILSYDDWTHYIVDLSTYSGEGQHIAFHGSTSAVLAGSIRIDNVSIGINASCARPLSVAVSEIGQTEALFTIEDPSDVLNYELTISTDENTYSEIIYQKEYAMTDALPATDYTVSVRSICSDGALTTAATASFRTQCDAVTYVPYVTGFDSQDDLQCWLIKSYNNFGSDNWQLSDGVMESPHGSNTYTSDEWLISPAIVLNGESGYLLTFDYTGRAYISNTPHLDVRVSTTNRDDTTAFTSLIYSESSTTVDNDVLEVSLDIDQFAGQTIYIAFIHNGHYDNGITIDNVAIRNDNIPEVEIIAPSEASIGDVTEFIANIITGGEGASLTWTSHMVNTGDAEKVDGSGDTLRIIYHAEGYDTITLYIDNGIGIDTAVAVVPVFDCLITHDMLPYSEDFESVTSSGNAPDAPQCWMVFGYQTSSYGNPYYPAISTNRHNSGTHSMAITEATGITPALMVLPKFEDELSTLQLSFYATTINANTAFEVGLVASTTNAASFVNVQTITVTSTMTEYTVTFPAEATGRIAFRVTSPTTLYIDDVTVTEYTGEEPIEDTTEVIEPVVCLAPTGVTVSNVTTSSATISWTAGSPTDTKWSIIIVSTTGGNEFDVNTTSYTLSGLTASTAYTVIVSTICNDDGDQEAADAVNFTTQAQSNGIDYVDGQLQASIYPNPASNSVSISCASDAYVVVYDISGHQVYRSATAACSHQIDLTGMPAGTYFVSISTSEASTVSRLIVR